MNKKIGIIGAIINCCSVVGFAISMLCRFNFGSYLFSLFIAFSLVAVISCFAYGAEKKRKVAGIVSVVFSAVYVAIISLVYFAQLTTVRLDNLTQQANSIINFQSFGLFFYYDLLGYALMSLSVFFAGLTVNVKTKADKALKWLMLIHGVFFISCLIAPMLGIFSTDSPDFVGIIVLEFWCVYFAPISVLSAIYFTKIGD